MSNVDRFWARPSGEVLAALDSCTEGLTSSVAASRLKAFGRNALTDPKVRPWLRLLLSRFASPLVIILMVAALVSPLRQGDVLGRDHAGQRGTKCNRHNQIEGV